MYDYGQECKRKDAGPLRVAGGLLQLRDEGTLRQGAGGRGASMAMAKDCSTRMNLFKKVHLFREKNMDGAMSEEDVANSYAEMANEAFDEVD